MSTRPASLSARLRILGALILLATVVAVGSLLTTADGWGVNRLNVAVWQALLGPVGLTRFITPEAFAALMNIVLFIPIGFALHLLIRTRWWILALAMASIAVETYQFSMGTRIASIGDVVTNTLGGAIGVLTGRAVVQRALRSGAAPSAAGAAHRAADDPAIPAAPHGRSADAPGAERDGHD